MIFSIVIFKSKNLIVEYKNYQKSFLVDDDENVDKDDKEQNKCNENNSEKKEDVEKNNNNNEKYRLRVLQRMENFMIL